MKELRGQKIDLTKHYNQEKRTLWIILPDKGPKNRLNKTQQSRKENIVDNSSRYSHVTPLAPHMERACICVAPYLHFHPRFV